MSRTSLSASGKGTPIRIRDIADVRIGAELRTGSGSKNGHEVVIGTAMMLIGANSRTVAAAVDARLVEVNRNLPPDIRASRFTTERNSCSPRSTRSPRIWPKGRYS